MEQLELNRIYHCDCGEGMTGIPPQYKYCIVTDPPFNVGYHYGEYSDRMPQAEYLQWLVGLLADYACCVIHYPEALYQLAIAMGQAPTRVISWVYNSNTPRQHRDAAFFRVVPDFNQVRQPYKNPSDRRVQALIASGSPGSRCYDWMEVNQVKNVAKDKAGLDHPCIMPVEVMQRIVGVIPQDYVVLDPFMGSGTTAVACVLEHRNFIGFELDKHYWEGANKRLRDLTGPFKLYGDIGK